MKEWNFQKGETIWRKLWSLHIKWTPTKHKWISKFFLYFCLMILFIFSRKFNLNKTHSKTSPKKFHHGWNPLMIKQRLLSQTKINILIKKQAIFNFCIFATNSLKKKTIECGNYSKRSESRNSFHDSSKNHANINKFLQEYNKIENKIMGLMENLKTWTLKIIINNMNFQVCKYTTVLKKVSAG